MYYIIIAISFSIMYSIAYAKPIVSVVEQVIELGSIDKELWSTSEYYIASFIISFLFMPIIFVTILLNRDKWSFIKYMADSAINRALNK